MPTCPCGLPQPYDDCCGRFHRGDARAPTAELLMRSRFSAFAVGDEDYLARTSGAGIRPRRIVLDPTRRWTRLEILGGSGGGLLETVATVEFRAHWVRRGRPGVLHENSAFRREEGRWVYVGAIPGSN